MTRWGDLHGEPNNRRRITGREYEAREDCARWQGCGVRGESDYCNRNCPNYSKEGTS